MSDISYICGLTAIIMIIYFATPYSHSDKSVIEDRYLKTANKVAELTAQGMVVMSPIFYGHNLLNYKEMPGDWQFWKNFCESFLYKCDELWVYMIDGWDKSTGVLAEIELAKELNLPIKYIEC